MAIKSESRSVKEVISSAESLRKAADQFAQVAAEMQRHETKKALFPWTQRQWDCLDAIITLASQCSTVLPAQVTAKRPLKKATNYLVKRQK